MVEIAVKLDFFRRIDVDYCCVLIDAREFVLRTSRGLIDGREFVLRIFRGLIDDRQFVLGVSRVLIDARR